MDLRDGKFCEGCHVIKSKDEFHKKADNVDGLNKVCKDCRSAQEKARRRGSEGASIRAAQRADRRRQRGKK